MGGQEHQEGQQKTWTMERRSQQSLRAQKTEVVNLQVWHQQNLGKKISFIAPVLQVPVGGDAARGPCCAAAQHPPCRDIASPQLGN